MQFTDEQIRMLAKCERDMDSGVQPYVRLEGSRERWGMEQEYMERFGLAQGQNVTWPIPEAIIRAKVEDIEKEIALRDGVAPETAESAAEGVN